MGVSKSRFRNALTFFFALLEPPLDPPPEKELLVADTWSAGRDSGTGCRVGVLMVLLIDGGGAGLLEVAAPEDISERSRGCLWLLLSLSCSFSRAVRPSGLIQPWTKTNHSSTQVSFYTILHDFTLFTLC